MFSRLKIHGLAACLLLTGITLVVRAVEVQTSIQEQDIQAYKRTDLSLYVNPKEAYELKQSHPEAVLFVDVRTRAEVEFVGSPTVMDRNIPLFEIDPKGWDEKAREYHKSRNKDFEEALQQAVTASGLTKDSPIIFMCRSGGRSAAAADIAAKLGFTRAYSLVEGFEGDTAKSGPAKGQRTVNGWKNAGLPWRY